MTAYQQHLKLTELVKTERKITDAVLSLIQQMDTSKAYAELGYSSLFDYLTRGQKYSEASAQRRISAARILKELPEIKSEITSGGINLTQLSKLAIAAKQEQKCSGTRVPSAKKKEVILKLKNKNTFETEKVLKEEFGYTSMPTEQVSAKYDDVCLTLKLTKAQYKKLQKVQSYLSHAKHDANFAEIIEILCDKIIQKKEGKTSSEENNQSEVKPPLEVKLEKATAAATVKAPRVFIPIATQRYILNKANNCCEYQSPLTKNKCQSRYQLQVDHKIPLARGGGNHPGNLRVLCRAHNLSEARRWGL